jgi:hypothetical protein
MTNAFKKMILNNERVVIDMPCGTKSSGSKKSGGKKK